MESYIFAIVFLEEASEDDSINIRLLGPLLWRWLNYAPADSCQHWLDFRIGHKQTPAKLMGLLK
jgi:hypothetical protein